MRRLPRSFLGATTSRNECSEPRPLPPIHNSGLGAAQTDNAPVAPDMLRPDASPLDADVDFEGDGPLPPELHGNDDPAPGIP